MAQTKLSRRAYAQTIEHLTSAIEAAGNTIFASIDQAAAAAAAGLMLRPTTLIIFGNPRGGTPLMDAVPLVALALPLKLLVWEQSGTVAVAFETAGEIAARYGVSGLDARVAEMDAALEALTAGL